jgi:ankyrin repeat protein
MHNEAFVREKIRYFYLDRDFNEGMNAVTYAAHHGSLKSFRLLVEKHANINIPSDDEWKQAPLFRASKGGTPEHLAIVKELLEHGAEINAQESWGQTPLAVASHKGIVEVVEVLIKAKADACIYDKGQRTALSRALEEMDKVDAEADPVRRQRYETVIRLLKDYTAAMGFQHPECSLGTGHPHPAK